MPLNLISDAWIPVRQTDGSRRLIAPWQMADPAIAAPDWPRADLNIACLELLIGLVFLADPPANPEDWEDRQRPDPERLRARLDPFAPAFNLTGDGPLFLQDLERIAGEANPPDMLFIDSAGGNAVRNNADLLVHRDRYPALDPALAAMALYAFQAHAPAGGAGNRTSMRGGGPMVTLVDPGQGMWALIWANVPGGKPAPISALPWMRATVTSEKAAEVWPAQAHPVEAFFGMPRRLRLVGADGGISGVIQRPYGTNYAGWVHPLSPYYRMKEGAELLPAHPRAGLFGYRNWLGVVAAQLEQGLRDRAAMVDAWAGRSGHAPAQILVAGWAMDNMKPRDFTFSQTPLVDLPADLALDLAGMVEAADLLGLSLRQALEPVAAGGEWREALREAFFARTQTAFEARLAELTAVNREDVARGWLADLRRAALALFEARALPGLDRRDPKAQAAIVAAHRNLVAAFDGRSPNGVKAYGRLGLTPPPRKPKEAA